MKTLDPKAAAEAIRGSLASIPEPTADDRHVTSYVSDVCQHLGLIPDTHNVVHVMRALERADIQPHLVQHYPKWVTVPGKDDPILVHSEAEEAAVAVGV